MAVTWEDEGIVLAVRRFGEHDAIVSIFTESQGRHAGLVKGGAGKTKRALLQPGNLVKAWWRARLDEQLGNFAIESLRTYGAEALSSPGSLAGLSAVCAMVEAALPEREPHPGVYRHTRALFEHLGVAGWEVEYVLWEVALLRDMGYGLDLTACVATGVTENLTFVSPRSGRAVSGDAAEPYRERLLPLPPFLRGETAKVSNSDIAHGMRLTGHFFELHVFAPHGQGLPAARGRFLERLAV